MFNFNKKELEFRDRLITSLTSQVNDLLDRINSLEKSHQATVKDLTDKLIALSSPFAFRELTRPEPKERLKEPPPRAIYRNPIPENRPPVPEKVS